MNKANNASRVQKLAKALSRLKTSRQEKLVKAGLDFLQTTHIQLVFEDIQDPFNVAASFRTMVNLGFSKAILLYQNLEKPKINSRIISATSSGVGKWVDYSVLTDTKSTFLDLKNKGYRIVSTTLNKKAKPLDKFDFARFANKQNKLALAFGNETHGISNVAEDYSDEFLYIPMATFKTSFNLSVSVAIVLWELTLALDLIRQWEVNEQITKNVLKNLLQKNITEEYQEMVSWLCKRICDQ